MARLASTELHKVGMLIIVHQVVSVINIICLMIVTVLTACRLKLGATV
jgi:hypothetical protein